MKKKLIQFAVLSLCIVILYACNKVGVSERSLIQDKRITFTEAKKWFDHQGQMVSNQAIKNNAPNKHLNIPKWDEAMYEKGTNNIEYIKVPLGANEERIIVLSSYNKQTKESEKIILPRPWLLIYRDSTQIFKTLVLQLIPRQKGIVVGDNFSGEARIYDWSGNLRWGYKYENGAKKFRINPLNEKSNKNETARYELVCNTVTNCIFKATCTAYSGSQGAVVTEVWGKVTDDHSNCMNQPYSPLAVLNEGTIQGLSWNCSNWSFQNSEFEQICAMNWVDDGDPGNPDPDPDNFPEYHLSYMVVQTSLKVVNIQEFLKCFNRSIAAKVTLYSDQPVPGRRIPVTVDAEGDSEVGHTFVTIEQTINGVTTSRTFGFYPNADVGILNPIKPRIIADDGNHKYSVKIEIEVDGSNIAKVLDVALTAPTTYDLYNYNCTDFGIAIARAAGLAVPGTTNRIFQGRNPGDLGEDIKSLPNFIDTPGTAPVKAGTCN